MKSGGWRKTEHARVITAALVLRNGRPAARKNLEADPGHSAPSSVQQAARIRALRAGIRRRWPC